MEGDVSFLNGLIGLFTGGDVDWAPETMEDSTTPEEIKQMWCLHGASYHAGGRGPCC